MNSGEIQGNSGVIQGNSGEFLGNQTKSFSLVFTRFHSISPVATVKTGENSGEKK